MTVPAGDGKVSEATMTRMQELGSAWIFKRAIQDDATWNNWQDIEGDPDTFGELVKIWKQIGNVNWDTSVDGPWLESFYKQQKELLDKIGQPAFTEFTRDGGEDGTPYILPGSNTGETFMEWIEKYIKEEFKIGTKDNWNPADIWLIQREKHWKDEIIKATKTKGPKTDGSIIAQLNQFNAIFRKLFRTRQILGISLKKIGSGAATFKEINVTNAYFKKIESTTMKLTGVKCYLGSKRINIKLDKNKKSPTYGEMIVDLSKEKRSIRKGLGVTGYPTIETQDSWLFIEDKDNNVEYKVQIKNTSTDKMDNLKFEPTEVGKGSARMGKATRAFVFDLMSAYKILSKFPKVHQNYPNTKAAFTRSKMDQTEKKIKNISTKCAALGIPFDMGGATDKLERITVSAAVGVVNIKETMGRNNERWTANSKLQQISFLNAVLSLDKSGARSVDSFCTDLIYLAAKQGRKGGYYNTGYGPFGKLY